MLRSFYLQYPIFPRRIFTSITRSDAPSLLRRDLHLPALIALTFFCVAGGAYGLEDAVGAGGAAAALAGILILPWLWSFPTALMTAELSAAMPEDGGYVVWVERAFGRFWGFQEGWLSWLCSFADNALYPVMFLDYLVYLRGDMGPGERWLIGAALIAVITWMNVRGIRLVGASLIVFTFIVLAPFVALIVFGAPQVQPSRWFEHSREIDWALLLSTLLWNTSGWDNAGCCAAEVVNPARNFPRAMIVSVVLVTAVYLFPLAVGVGVAGDWSAWKEGYFPQVAAQIGGPWLGVALTLAGLVSAAGMLNALLCTSARVPYAMAERALLPTPLARLHRRHGTPWPAIVLNSIGVTALIPFSFQDLIELDMLLYAAALVLEFAALIWLRVSQPDMPRPFRMPFGLTGVVLASAPPIALCVLSMALANRATCYVGAIGIAVGLLVYFCRAKRAATSGSKAPRDELTAISTESEMD